MALLAELFYLLKSKEELLERFYDPATSYTEYVDISNKLRKINRQIHEMKNMAYHSSKSIG